MRIWLVLALLLMSSRPLASQEVEVMSVLDEYLQAFNRRDMAAWEATYPPSLMPYVDGESLRDRLQRDARGGSTPMEDMTDGQAMTGGGKIVLTAFDTSPGSRTSSVANGAGLAHS